MSVSGNPGSRQKELEESSVTVWGQNPWLAHSRIVNNGLTRVHPTLRLGEVRGVNSLAQGVRVGC